MATALHDRLATAVLYAVTQPIEVDITDIVIRLPRAMPCHASQSGLSEIGISLNYARKLAENLAFHGFGVPRGD
ncbi:MAG: hypothetical protein GY937_16585 [bacterium]|nr:hypothetical protein [bacterium]